jgi:hypothetical protein
MPVFDDYAFGANEEVDALYGELFVIRPYAKAADRSAAPGPDPARDVLQIVGVFVSKPANPREPNAYDTREYRRPGAEGDVPHVEFSTAARACFVGFDLRPGDHVVRLSNATIYEARTPVTTPNGTIRVPLNRLGPTP